MKKIFSLILVVLLVFTLSACGGKNTTSNTNSPSQTDTFVKPENYAYVMLISINPQFKIYLDKNDNVLALESVNDDAKSFMTSINYENKTIGDVVENIIEQANKNGFIKENATVNFEITEQKNEINVSDILNDVVAVTKQKAADLKIEIKTQIKESDETTSEETSSKEEDKTTSSTPTESQPVHKHEFSAATCTAPQKCSCGETSGTALGHKWQEATCKTPKTCSVCKATEGANGEHKYSDGKCTYCNEKQKINPKDGINPNGYYYLTIKDDLGDENLGVYQFYDSTMFLIDIFTDNEEYKISEETKTYNGKTYFHSENGDGFTQKYTLTDTEIIIKDYNSENPSEIRMIVNYQYDLEIVYSTEEETPVGTILDLVE